MIRVAMPHHLRTLSGVKGELLLEEDEARGGADGPPTVSGVIDAIETRFPMLVGLVRDRASRQRRPLVRFFACGRDLSHESLDTPLPDAVREGREPFMIVGAMAGG